MGTARVTVEERVWADDADAVCVKEGASLDAGWAASYGLRFVGVK